MEGGLFFGFGGGFDGGGAAPVAGIVEPGSAGEQVLNVEQISHVFTPRDGANKIAGNEENARGFGKNAESRAQEDLSADFADYPDSGVHYHSARGSSPQISRLNQPRKKSTSSSGLKPSRPIKPRPAATSI